MWFWPGALKVSQKILEYVRPKGTNLEFLTCRNFGVPVGADTFYCLSRPGLPDWTWKSRCQKSLSRFFYFNELLINENFENPIFALFPTFHWKACICNISPVARKFSQFQKTGVGSTVGRGGWAIQNPIFARKPLIPVKNHKPPKTPYLLLKRKSILVKTHLWPNQASPSGAEGSRVSLRGWAFQNLLFARKLLIPNNAFSVKIISFSKPRICNWKEI